MSRRLGAPRLKTRILEILDHRIQVCRDAERRYAEMVDAGGGVLGSVELAKRSEATERSARMEAELIRREVAELTPANR